MLLIYVCAAWLFGIWAASFVAVPWEGAIIIGFSSMSLGLLWRRQTLVLLFGACLCAFLAGQMRYQTSLYSAPGDALSRYNGGGTIEMLGWVSAEPELRDRTSHLRFEVSQAGSEGVWRSATGTALLFVSRYPAHQYGEELRVVGKIEAPQQFGEFDYPAYLARQGIGSVATFPRVTVLRQGAGLAGWAGLLALKERLAANLARVLPEPQASLAQGMLLGLRAGIPQDLMDTFNSSGLTHVIVISGQNLSLLAGYIVLAGQPIVGRRRVLWLSLVVVVLYALLAGAQPPVVRGAIMAAIFTLASYLGRQREGAIALAVAAAGMTAVQPLLLWDVSFQLSFSATAGLILIAPTLQERFSVLWPEPRGKPTSGSRGRRYLVESLAVTLAATAAVLPVLLVDFQRLSLVAPLANLLVVPALPWIMLTGALASLAGFLPGVGEAAAWAAWPFLTYMVSAVEVLGNLPMASREVTGFQPPLALAYYSLIGLLLLWRPPFRKAAP